VGADNLVIALTWLLVLDEGRPGQAVPCQNLACGPDLRLDLVNETAALRTRLQRRKVLGGMINEYYRAALADLTSPRSDAMRLVLKRYRGPLPRDQLISIFRVSSSAFLEADERPSRTSQPQSRTKIR
jgi:hypothetical protein